MNQFLEAALHYASLGWQVFPLAAGQKVPITAHGVKDATTDEAQIREWWAKWPNANIGMACGAGSGVYVVDVDVSASGDVNGLESLKEFPALLPTIRQDTPRGGFHAFYRTDNPPANRNSFRPGIDIRGDGYYVVLAPSIHPNGGSYVWSAGCAPWEIGAAEYPDCVRPVTRAPWATPALATAQPSRVTVPQPYSDDALRRASLYLATCDAAVQGCGGHDKLLWAAGAMTWGCDLPDDQAYDILAREYNPRCVPPWDLCIPKDEKDFRRKIIESRKHPPDKPHRWILDDPAYAPPECAIDVAKLLREAPDGEVVRLHQPVAVVSAVAMPDRELQFLMRPTGLLGEVCSWINSTAIREQPFLTLACSLVFLGALFGRKVRDKRNGRTNLYCMSVAPSSAGKNHALNQIRKLCLEAECLDLLGGDMIASDSAIEERMSRQPATLFLWDEIGYLLSHIKSGKSQHHSMVVPLLMKLYSSAGSVYTGREYAEKEKQRTIIQPCCCIYGVSTPERFTDGLTVTEIHDGWLSRCLVFRTDETPPKNRREIDDTIPPGIIERVGLWWKRQIYKDTDGHTVSQYVTPSNTAQPQIPIQIIIPTQPAAEKNLIDFDNQSTAYGVKHPELSALWLKAEENARRIALIVACGENFDNPEITPAIADYSCRLVHYLLSDFGRNVVPEIVSNSVEQEKRKIIAVIYRAGVEGIGKRELTRKTPWIRDKRARDNMLEDLVEADEITAEIILANEKTKQTKVIYRTAANFQKHITHLTKK